MLTVRFGDPYFQRMPYSQQVHSIEFGLKGPGVGDFPPQLRAQPMVASGSASQRRLQEPSNPLAPIFSGWWFQPL